LFVCGTYTLSRANNQTTRLLMQLMELHVHSGLAQERGPVSSTLHEGGSDFA